jgi:hypothetical protein
MNTFLKNVKKAAKRPSLGGKSKSSKTAVNQETGGGGGEEGGDAVQSPRSLDEFEDVVIDKYHHPHQSPPGSVKTDYMTASLPVRTTLGSYNFDNPTTTTTPNPQQPLRSIIATPFPPLFNEANTMFQLCNMTTIILEVRKNNIGKSSSSQTTTTTHQVKQIQDVFMNTPVPLITLTNICIDKTQVLKTILFSNTSNTNITAMNALECILQHHRYWQEKKLLNSSSSSTATKQQKQQKNKKKDDDDGMFSWMSSCGLSTTFSFDELTDTLTNTFCGGDLCAVYNDDVDDGGTAVTNKAVTENNSLSSSRIIAISDTSLNNNIDEVSYVIELNTQEERITIIFKGPRTKIVDSVTDSILAPYPEGGSSNCDTTSSNGIGIHGGFYNALFGNTSGSSSDDGGGGSKYMEIQQIVEQLLITEARNYKLYLTGNGSGGAIATLFGLYAAGGGGASNNNIPVPITIVSVASPRVGNMAYATLFADYESMGLLRHLRIVNVGDPIPNGPRGFELVGTQSGDEEPSYHTGIEMLLSTNGVDFTYSGLDVLQKKKQPQPATLTSNTTDKSDVGDYLACHYSTVYSDRMAYVELDLQQLSLNALYREKAYGSLTTSDELWV